MKANNPIPLFVSPEPMAVHAQAFEAVMFRRSQALAFQSTGSALTLSDFVNERAAYSVSEGIATVHINDVLARGYTNVEKMLGATDYADVIAELEQATNDPQVKGILLEVNSPGGSVVGMMETANAVLAARQSKPVVAMIEQIGASAAYGISVGASAIVVSSSAIVGSIGTIMTHTEVSKMLAAFGVTATIVTPAQSDLKASGNQVRAIQDNERAFMQERIESMNAGFTSWVQSNRPGVAMESMRGQWFSGSEAVSIGLADAVGGKKDAMDALASLLAIA